MLILDDILLFPIKGLTWLCREIDKAVQQELESEAEEITERLSELYMMLETGRITEEEFDREESTLLDRLDQLKGEEDPDDDQSDEWEGGASDAHEE